MIPPGLRDPYIPAAGWLQRLDAPTRVWLGLACILCAALLPEGAWAAYVSLFFLLLAGLMAGGLPARALYERSLLALPFVLAALPLLWSTPGAAWAWGITGAGGVRFFSITLKAWLSVQAAVLLTLTTPFPELLVVLRSWHFPHLLLSVIGLMWRYLFIMAAAARQMMIARAARSASMPGRLAGGSLTWRGRVTGGMAGSLLIRSFEQAERTYAAMLARGYDGEPRGLPLPSFSTASKTVAVVGTGFLIGIVVLGWMLVYGW